jgi:hypothetical protein
MSDKQAALDAFVAKWSDLPEQKSEGWYASRMYNIGASEMSTLQGTNKYQDIRRLIEMHCKLVEFGDKRAVNWGSVLEQVITMMTEIIFDCKITEMGSVPTVGVTGQRCSPDGVALVKMLGDLIVSFEFKAPKNRMPRGEIPGYYLPQVFSCLQAVEPADIGIFVDVVIRRCAITDWTFANVNYDWADYHRKTKFYTVVAKSVLYFMGDNTCSAPINLGECKGAELDQYLSDTAEHRKYRVHYGTVHMGSGTDTSWADEMDAEMPDNCVAYLPIKIMKVCIVPVQKIPGYVNRYQDIISKVIGVIREIMSAPEEERHMLCNVLCAKNGW